MVSRSSRAASVAAIANISLRSESLLPGLMAVASELEIIATGLRISCAMAPDSRPTTASFSGVVPNSAGTGDGDLTPEC